ncbi:unnamed protein product [Rotaria magnacalcarata]|uniref:Uncharacterized protein n=1 Tax=Rotaria magnacalcarata TaxID=392030 RepID=A0A820KHN9_9BILA|nr:unnamed protein product [Rotaria magnacalcarata]CAF4341745.1 unnamed protein product [Rotaria magnacalcarata]
MINHIPAIPTIHPNVVPRNIARWAGLTKTQTALHKVYNDSPDQSKAVYSVFRKSLKYYTDNSELADKINFPSMGELYRPPNKMSLDSLKVSGGNGEVCSAERFFKLITDRRPP